MSADDADRLDRKRKKKNPDQGFSGTDKLFICQRLCYYILKVHVQCNQFIVILNKYYGVSDTVDNHNVILVQSLDLVA